MSLELLVDDFVCGSSMSGIFPDTCCFFPLYNPLCFTGRNIPLKWFLMQSNQHQDSDGGIIGKQVQRRPNRRRLVEWFDNQTYILYCPMHVPVKYVTKQIIISPQVSVLGPLCAKLRILSLLCNFSTSIMLRINNFFLFDVTQKPIPRQSLVNVPEVRHMKGS